MADFTLGSREGEARPPLREAVSGPVRSGGATAWLPVPLTAAPETRDPAAGPGEIRGGAAQGRGAVGGCSAGLPGPGSSSRLRD